MEHDDTRERLIRLTARQLAEHGFAGMTLRGVAAQAGVGAATVFHHFPGGKQALYEAAVQHVIDEIAALATLSYGEDAGLSAEDVIALRAASFWDFLTAKPELAAMLLRESFDENAGADGMLQENASVVTELAVRFIEEAQEAGDLGRFDARRFLVWSTNYAIGYFGAPGIHRQLFGAERSLKEEKRVFLAMLRGYLRGNMPGDPG
jgi:AcrR family transcriptional regulator